MPGKLPCQMCVSLDYEGAHSCRNSVLGLSVLSLQSVISSAGGIA